MVIPSAPDIPVTAADVDYDFDATASPPPGAGPAGARSLSAEPDPEAADPGHLATPEEWAEIVARAEGRQP